ncbi:hypothetical protein A3K70_04590 [Candidatus Bathyarchaeota archaeon RBG_16_48_13]|nr:MAG: hypothetical protein A3K70_04590 [Candidatus Bathyarchaeota archaeon RBG_16_48_13]
MMYSIAASGILSGIALWKLPYRASTDAIEESGHNMSRGLAIAIGLNGLFLFLSGTHILFNWIFTSPGGGPNILFGGVAALGGLNLMGFSAALFWNRGLKAVSYSAAVLGAYLVVDAYSILAYGMTSDPLKSALAYLSVAAATFLSVPATHSDNKWLRLLFSIGAIAYAAAWLYLGANTTFGHLKPPAPAT